jgi:hypothetical protein
MSTAIVPVDENSGSYFSNPSKFELIQRVAKVFAESQLVPAAFQKNVPNCIIAVEMAERMSASPLMVIQNLNIIHGKPSFGAAFLIGSINSCGRFTPLRFDVSGEGDDKTCVAWAFQKSAANRSEEIAACATLAEARKKNLPVLESAPVSIKIAKDEGWFGKAGSKWKTMPDLMLRYRAATWFSRMYAPDVAMGMPTQEEVIDVEAPPEVMPDPVVRQPPTKGIAAAIAAAKDPVVDAEPPAPPAEEAKAEPPKAEEKPRRTRSKAAESTPAPAPEKPAEPTPASNPDLEAATPPPAQPPAATPAPGENPAPAAPAKPAAEPATDLGLDDPPELPTKRDELIEVLERPTANGVVFEMTFQSGFVAFWNGKKTDIPSTGSLVDVAYEERVSPKGRKLNLATKLTVVA